jgi:hypothetical protein
MREIRRRTALEAVGATVVGGLAGCSSTGSSDGGTPSSTAPGTETSTATATDTAGGQATGSTIDAPAAGPVDAPDSVARLVLAAVDAGDLERLQGASVGFENLEGELSPDATLYLSGDGDTLATLINQGDATAREAYGNFAPDGRYVEVIGVEDIPTTDRSDWRDRLNEMSGPTVDSAVIATPTFSYRVNIEGSWYEGSGEPEVTAIEVDGGWYAGTAITPWYVAMAFVADGGDLTAEQHAEIQRTVELPLGDTETTSG